MGGVMAESKIGAQDCLQHSKSLSHFGIFLSKSVKVHGAEKSLNYLSSPI
jgi:hypothetical protein